MIKTQIENNNIPFGWMVCIVIDSDKTELLNYLSTNNFNIQNSEKSHYCIILDEDKQALLYTYNDFINLSSFVSFNDSNLIYSSKLLDKKIITKKYISGMYINGEETNIIHYQNIDELCTDVLSYIPQNLSEQEKFDECFTIYESNETFIKELVK